MSNMIERNIYVLRDASCVAQPIEYVQGTNAVPILLHVRDYDIPAGSTARVYVEWPSTKGEYDESGVTIDGNDILIEPKDTLFSEIGKSSLQVCIVNGEKILVTFSYPVMVKKNRVPGITEPSKNQSDFLDKYLKEIKEEMAMATEWTETATTSATAATKSEAAAASYAANAKTSEDNALAYMKATQQMAITIVGDLQFQVSEEGVLQAVYDDGE